MCISNVLANLCEFIILYTTYIKGDTYYSNNWLTNIYKMLSIKHYITSNLQLDLIVYV